MDYPRLGREIHQIELSSDCNLKCPYCPSHMLGKPGWRGRLHMEEGIFVKSLEKAVAYYRAGTQTELWLMGLGESLLHPRFLEYVERTRSALPTTALRISTNGLLFTEEHARVLGQNRVRVHISPHRPEKAEQAAFLARKYGILEFVGTNIVSDPFNWAGLVDWKAGKPAPCQWLQKGWLNILSDGSISTCCFDAKGVGIVGHVNEVREVKVKPYELCASCNLIP